MKWEIFLVEFEVKTLIQLINRLFCILKLNQNRKVREDHAPNLEQHQSYSRDMLNHDCSLYCTHYQLVFGQSEVSDGLGFACDHIEGSVHRKHYLQCVIMNESLLWVIIMSHYHEAQQVCPLEILIWHVVHQHSEKLANHIFLFFLELPMTCEYMKALSPPIYCLLPLFYPSKDKFRVKWG